MANPLHDGKNPIRSISILGLLKDNEDYLDWLFPKLKELEAEYAVEFSYFFYENNSKDTTPQKLRAFMEGRKGRLISEKLDKPHYNTKEYGYERVQFLANLRTNHLKQIREELDSDWTLIIDSNIYFEKDALTRMMTMDPRSDSENICMLTCNTKEVRKNYKFNPINPRNDNERKPFLSQNHMYDTYAIVDLDNRLAYPFCRFKECQICEHRLAANNMTPYEGNTIEVRAAFGGFVMIPTAFLKPWYVEWKTTEFRFGELSSCEHIYFCDMIRIASGGGRVVIVQAMDDLQWLK